VIERYFPAIMKGVVVTIEIAAAVVVTGTCLGLRWRSCGVSAARSNALIVIFVDVFRALPPLVLVLLVYFGLPTSESICRPSRCSGLCCRSCWPPLPRRSFGPASCRSQGSVGGGAFHRFGFLGTLAYVVLPQAIRLTVPPLTNRTIAITKNTALGTVIGVGEILNQATTAQSFSGNATPLMMGRSRM
jgi:polar amino acid transport system permease protein